MSDIKETAKKLYDYAIAKKLNFPKIWEETKCIQTCAATLVRNIESIVDINTLLIQLFFIKLVHRISDGFDTEEAFKDLLEKYGSVEEKITATVEEKKKRKASGAAEAVIAAAVEEDDDDDNRPKKVKKIDSVAEEENRVVADAIREMATIYFKNKDTRKGGTLTPFLYLFYK